MYKSTSVSHLHRYRPSPQGASYPSILCDSQSHSKDSPRPGPEERGGEERGNVLWRRELEVGKKKRVRRVKKEENGGEKKS